jgi:hypothetical protein
MDLNDFGVIPAELPSVQVTNARERELLEWVTTPHDLREDGEKSLAGWAPKHGMNANTCLVWLAKPHMRLARRALALERGLSDYKVGVILDAAYAKAVQGDQRAMSTFLSYYKTEADSLAVSEAPAAEDGTSGPVKPVAEMSPAEIEAKLAELDQNV